MLTSATLLTIPKSTFELREVSAVAASACDALNILQEISQSEKEYINKIRKIERHIRSAIEYREYIKFLKESQGLGRCAFLGAVSYEDRTAALEMHHAPFTLWDIVDIEIRRAVDTSPKGFRTFEIVETILLAHQENKIGLVPLSGTCHELTHDGRLFIPLNRIFGDWQGWMKERDAWITNAQRDIIKKMQDLTQSYNDDPDQIPNILQVVNGRFNFSQ